MPFRKTLRLLASMALLLPVLPATAGSPEPAVRLALSREGSGAAPPMRGGSGPAPLVPDDAETGSGRAPGVRSEDSVRAADFGVRCDGVTLDTAGLQRAIDVAGTRHAALLLPGGVCLEDGLSVRSALTLRGHGSGQTTLLLPPGTARPALAVSVATAYATGGVSATTVLLEGFRIAASNRDDAAGKAAAHGIALANGKPAVNTRVVLRDVAIAGVPGDGIHAGPGFSGWVESEGSYIMYPGGYGIAATGVTDWRWFGGDIAGAEKDNLLLSGAVAMQFFGVNFYVPRGDNINLYAYTQAYFSGCYVDLAGRHGVEDNLNATGWAVFDGTRFRWSSQATTATAYDIYADPAAAGSIFLHGSRFAKASDNGFSANNPQGNIGFDRTSMATVVIDATTVFDAGSPTTVGVVTNNPARIIGQTSAGLGTPGAAVTDLHANGSAAYRVATPANGSTYPMLQGQRIAILRPAAALASLAIQLPPDPQDGQSVHISTSQAVAALSVLAPGKTTLDMPTALASGQSFEALYSAGGGSWVRN